MSNTASDKIKSLFFNEISFALAICSVVIGVCLFITSADSRLREDVSVLQRDVNNIQNNHLTHIQGSLDKLQADTTLMKEDISSIKTSIKFLTED